MMIKIGKDKYISEDELIFKASRSSGPGGQNVNKVNSRITLFYDLANCENFSDEQKRLIANRLAARAYKNGVVRIVSQKHRTQKANRQAAVERLQQLLTDALRTKPVRRKTKMPNSAKQSRLKEKKKRSILKQQRAGEKWLEDFTE